MISSKIAESVDENRLAAKVHYERQVILDESGLDLNSCLQFLIDLYSQWIKAQVGNLRGTGGPQLARLLSHPKVQP